MVVGAGEGPYNANIFFNWFSPFFFNPTCQLGWAMGCSDGAGETLFWVFGERINIYMGGFEQSQLPSVMWEGLLQCVDGLIRTARLALLWEGGFYQPLPGCLCTWDFICKLFLPDGSGLGASALLGPPQHQPILQIWNLPAFIIMWANSLKWMSEWINVNQSFSPSLFRNTWKQQNALYVAHMATQTHILSIHDLHPDLNSLIINYRSGEFFHPVTSAGLRG